MTPRWLLLVLVLAGCDSLFSLVHVPEPDDGGAGDGRDGDVTIDARPDAKPCVPIGHDEDTDNVDDACDSCLSVPNDGMDSDGDGVDNACDLNLAGAKDTVVFATGFPNEDVLTTSFTSSGSVAWNGNNKGQATVFENTVLMLTTDYAPTRILVRTSGVGEGTGAQVDIHHSNTTCEVLGSDCSKTVVGVTCLRATGGATGTLSVGAANVKTIEMRGPSTIQCHIETATEMTTAGSTGTFAMDRLFFSTTAGGAVTIDSIEIFGIQ